jgi:cullin-associated NEDD8-dissociated protein 1
MSPQRDIFTNAIDYFGSDQEEIRTAAAFAAGLSRFAFTTFHSLMWESGNIAIGSLQHFLHAIVKLVESDAKKRLLSLHALKEVG